MALPEHVTGKAHIDYTQNTLFGPLAKQAECQVSLEHTSERLVLKVFQPLPEDLQDAQTVVFALQGRRTSAVVRDSRRLADQSLQLQLEAQ
ncbi:MULTISPECIES: hypothetical protein [Pseudomonas]|jgi:hypothetical protein|uniref:Uncharacterized protein n=1 Tax=Pseudomonas quebecensis TaxID=2995174 RepID=A0ABY6Q969_9PSED|nr:MULTISPECIES: hypothetical protein [Pseudomonas]MCP1510671.1 hypothetical protein [Pseudomonas rhodesiae]MCX4066973.1 hypothetical protein [Pseudomonas quebecensis]MDF9769484.1 hypothetical protein [Pseudomonas rhodesiae]UZW16542.1 hypothetical protein OSC50_14150 [Pseudomonas quebecensis]UZW26044.1 hypothetical protein OSC48_11330 [Pseudomonas quebecensis]